jgi:hypothetical protein
VGRLWRDYSLSITAAVLFLITWLVYAVVEWFDFKHEMSWYGEPVALGSYLTRFFAFSLENWQSEFLHIFFLVWLASFLVHKGSSESRDSDDRIEEALERLERRLDAMEERGSEANSHIPGARRDVFLFTKRRYRDERP